MLAMMNTVLTVLVLMAPAPAPAPKPYINPEVTYYYVGLLVYWFLGLWLCGFVCA